MIPFGGDLTALQNYLTPMSGPVLTAGSGSQPSWNGDVPLAAPFTGPVLTAGNFGSASSIPSPSIPSWSQPQSQPQNSPSSFASPAGGFDWTKLFNSLMQTMNFNRGGNGMFGGTSLFGNGPALFGGNSGMYSR